MTDLKSSFPSDPDVLEVLAVFQEELASAAERPDVLGTDPALWPRFAGYYQGLARLPRRARRALQRQRRRSLGGLELLLALGQAPALAATINVDGVNCDLIEAITAADNDGFAGGCAAGSGADTIVLPPNSTHTLTAMNNSTYRPTGLPVITSAMTIVGNGSTITRDPTAPDFFRILAVSRTGNLTLQETTVSGGRAMVFPENGGGVLNFGTLTLVNSVVAGNRALREGGGVFNGFVDTLTLINSTISSNVAEDGGGVFNEGFLTLSNSTVSGNSTSQSGGGVFSSRTLILLNSTVSTNTAVRDGGGLRTSGTATVENSTVSGNSAGQDGGGLRTSSRATVINSTISGNFAGRNGGGLYGRGNLTLTNSTVSGNSTSGNGGGVQSTSSTLNLYQTLILGNTASSQGRELSQSSGTVNANRFNLFGFGDDAGVTPNFSPGATDFIPGVALTAILDTALRNNSGPTMTHALVAGSPAIDAGGTCFPTTDQRGIPRPQGVDANGDGFPDCDIGAFEVGLPSQQPPPPPPNQSDLTLTKADSPDRVFEGQPLTYTLIVRNNGPNNATGATVTDPLPGSVTFVSATPSQGTCSGTATVTCPLGSLANGTSATVTIVVTPTSPGALSNTASVTGSPSDPNSGNNSSTSATTVAPIPPIRADLALTQTDAPDPGAVAEPLVYTLTATNHGPSTATGVQVTDILPAGVALAGPSIPSQGTCAGTGPVVCHLGTLGSGVSATVTINVLPTQVGMVSNTASVVGIEPDITPGNNSAPSATTINERAVVPTPQGRCNRSACGVQLTCTLGAPCADRRVTLFVPGRTVRLSEGALAKAPARIKFAAGVANIPPGGNATVRLRLTSRGKTIISTFNKKRIRGVMQIRNAARTVISSTPIRIRLR